MSDMAPMFKHWRRPDPEDLKGAEARKKTEQALKEVRAQAPDVHAVSDSLRVQTSDNHFVERIAGLIRGG